MLLLHSVLFNAYTFRGSLCRSLPFHSYPIRDWRGGNNTPYTNSADLLTGVHTKHRNNSTATCPKPPQPGDARPPLPAADSAGGADRRAAARHPAAGTRAWQGAAGAATPAERARCPPRAGPRRCRGRGRLGAAAGSQDGGGRARSPPRRRPPPAAPTPAPAASSRDPGEQGRAPQNAAERGSPRRPGEAGHPPPRPPGAPLPLTFEFEVGGRIEHQDLLVLRQSPGGRHLARSLRREEERGRVGEGGGGGGEGGGGKKGGAGQGARAAVALVAMPRGGCEPLCSPGTARFPPRASGSAAPGNTAPPRARGRGRQRWRRQSPGLLCACARSLPPLLPVDSPHGRPAPEPSGKKWLLRTPGRGCGSGARAPREELQLPACRAAGGRQGGRREAEVHAGGCSLSRCLGALSREWGNSQGSPLSRIQR